MKSDVSDMLRKLIRTQEITDTEGEVVSEAPVELTTLGVPLIRKSNKHYVIDLTNTRVFRNLHTFVQMLTEEVIEQCGFGIADIMVRRKVDRGLTPELCAIGLDWIMIYVRLDAADSLPFDYRNFGNCMQVIFRALQTEKWGGILFPEFFGLKNQENDLNNPPALLFPFHLHDREEKNGNYFLVEYSRPGRFLRITIEDAAGSRLQLKRIPHRVVDQLVRPSYFADIYPTAEKIHQGMLHEAMNHRSEYQEDMTRLPDFFAHLQREGLPDLQKIHFTWPTDDRQMLFLENITAGAATESLIMLVKEIQLLDDPHALNLLSKGYVVEMIAGSFHIYFDVSRYGACLNVSFDELRTALTMENYLSSMPALQGACEKRQGALHPVRIFLIHHITAEVIGLIQALEGAGCAAVSTFFVQYLGVVPESYLETLMSVPREKFQFYSLQKIETRQNLIGFYQLSRQFTPLAEMEDINKTLLAENLNFLGAMRLASGRLFLKEVVLARQNKEPLLLVEDGGYLAPLLNRFCLEMKTVGEVFDYFHLSLPDGDEKLFFSDWLAGTFLGSVEHTRNGYDYNNEVYQEFGRLQFPAVSIALSRLKRGPEAKECALSILNATENILNRLGMLFSRRTITLLGSSGAIGNFLKQELLHRVSGSHLFGVDIAAPENSSQNMTEVKTLDDLGKDAIIHTDMFIGVVGHSILRQKHLEEIMLYSRHRKIFFISGSTKTVEFADVQDYLQSLRDAVSPCVRGRAVQVEFNALRDLQTGILQGYEAAISFPEDPSKNKIMFLLGELMPINFLYYGISREIVDEVMAQLFTLSCGFVSRQRSEDKLPSALFAVDYEIDGEAGAISFDGKSRT
ncbi:MAG TPA: hypothetical protein PLG94_15785 [Smithellaceae bacterium]|nr:hypothetical protein [Smithellaceae bacterium]